ncbi:MAG: acetate/propionate family kinase [Pseudomonadota bacterium]|nr:acetate/propionate family kinase [Pseudomonadota bacterium]
MPSVLTFNGGSSSIRFAIFDAERPVVALLRGKLQRIGGEGASLSIEGREGQTSTEISAAGCDHETAVEFLLDWLAAQPLFATVTAVGHRVVHGMLHSEPERVTPELLEELRGVIPFDPEHLPREIQLIEAVQHRNAALAQVVCFDTAFHHSMPRVARQMAIPRHFEQKGVRRYGFHGLSYTFLVAELQRLADPAIKQGRVILAHLGSGASLAAVADGRCLDTSMGFTPTAGLIMGTRSGDLDPGLMSYLSATQGMTVAQFQAMVNHESGLLGVSETSADVRDLLAREATDVRAAEAIELFCYQAKKWIGSFAAALGGLDTLVFAGGVGENSPAVRARICRGMGFLGIDIDESLNNRQAARISSAAGRVSVRVIRTDEESVIAQATIRLLGWDPT